MTAASLSETFVKGKFLLHLLQPAKLLTDRNLAAQDWLGNFTLLVFIFKFLLKITAVFCLYTAAKIYQQNKLKVRLLSKR